MSRPRPFAPASPQRLLVPALLATAAALAGCRLLLGVGIACLEDDHCPPDLPRCIADASGEQGACGPALVEGEPDPLCSPNPCDTNLDRPICDEGVCKARCDDDDEVRLVCGADEYCDPLLGSCVQKCAPVGAEGAGGVCAPSGLFEERCVDWFDCTSSVRLCDRRTDSDTFNQCTAPDLAYDTCASHAAFAAGRGDAGPLLYFDSARDTGEGLACAASPDGSHEWVLRMGYADPNGDVVDGALPTATDRVRVSVGGRAPRAPDAPVVLSGDGSLDVFEVRVCLGEVLGDVALQLTDTAGARSNATCALP